MLLNAADAMAGVMDRPRTLIVQTAIHSSSSVQLLVRDSGIGVDPLAIEKMFAAFYTTKAHGMGVGLAVSRSIIESREWQLWAAPMTDLAPSLGFTFQTLFENQYLSIIARYIVVAQAQGVNEATRFPGGHRDAGFLQLRRKLDAA